MVSTTNPTWHALPNELKLAVVDALEAHDDVISLSQVDQRTYQACVPALFNTVRLDSFSAIEAFLDSVPRTYLSYVETLDVCTAPTHPFATPVLARVRSDALIALLSATPRLVDLTLRVSGTLDKSILAPFPYLYNLRTLSVANVGDEAKAPLSERLVVSMAFSIPRLTSLSLSRITRSALHATDLAGVFTYVPLATNDADIPGPSTALTPSSASPTPLTSSTPLPAALLDPSTPLSLPTLLLLPTLRRLALKDTHLGDARWGTVTPACRLDVLDLGACVHEEEAFNSFCTRRIVEKVGDSLEEVGIGSALGLGEDDEDDDSNAPTTTQPTLAPIQTTLAPTPAISTSTTASTTTQTQVPTPTPLTSLRKLHISPYFPLERVVDTMSALAGSPVESVRIECFKEDVVDVCKQMEVFLRKVTKERGGEEHGENDEDQEKTLNEEEPSPAPSAARASAPASARVPPTQTQQRPSTSWFARLKTIRVDVARAPGYYPSTPSPLSASSSSFSSATSSFSAGATGRGRTRPSRSSSISSVTSFEEDEEEVKSFDLFKASAASVVEEPRSTMDVDAVDGQSLTAEPEQTSSASEQTDVEDNEDEDEDDEDEEDKAERHTAARRLEALCKDMRLGGVVWDERARAQARAQMKLRMGVGRRTGALVQEAKVVGRLGRAMTL